MRSAPVFVLALIAGSALGPGCRRRPVSDEHTIREEPVRVIEVAPRDRSVRAEVYEARLEDPATPLIVGRFMRAEAELDVIAAPAVEPEWLAVLIRSPRQPLRRCAELRAEFPEGYVTTPLEAFDRRGFQVRYELPLAGLLRMAIAPSVVIHACDRQWSLGSTGLAELRRLALLTLFRRAQVMHEAPIPSVLDDAGGRPSWRRGATDSERGPVVQGTLPLLSGDELTLTYAPQTEDALVMHFASARSDLSRCEVAIEVGPALVTPRRGPEESGQWRIHDMPEYFMLGVVDHARLVYCDRAVNLDRFLGGIRRHVLLSLLARAEQRSQVTPSIDLPPAPRGSSPPPALPRARRDDPGGDVVAPEDAPSLPPDRPL